nr:PTS transporter subunit EIIC [Enterobacter hormaechei]
MYHEAHTKNKKIAAGILFSAALTCFLTGITEPVEFTFIFVCASWYIARHAAGSANSISGNSPCMNFPAFW